MDIILNSIFGEALYSSLDPNIQAMLCVFVFSLCAWLIVRIFRAIGGMF